MEFLISTIYKVDHIDDLCEEISPNRSSSDFNRYIEDLLAAIYRSGSKRKFEFASLTTEVARAFYEILDFVQQEDIEGNVRSRHELIAERLLIKEKDAQATYSHLTDIQRGVLIQAVTKDEAGLQIVIVKAEFDKFLDESSNYQSKDGLPEKKKVYKAFVAQINNDFQLTSILVYDSQSVISKYWWNNFLELKEVYTDSQNTKNAFESLEKRVFRPMEKKHKADYINLRNATVKYFQTEGDFDMEYYLNDVIGDYQPIDDSLDINEIKTKIQELPDGRTKFDLRFTKLPKDIKARFLKTTVKMTEEIDLVLNEGVPDLNAVVKPDTDVHGNKIVIIRSDSGYEYFKRRETDQES